MNLTLRNVIEWHVGLSAAAAVCAVFTGIGDVGSLAAGSLWALANVGVWTVLVRTLVRARQGKSLSVRARVVTSAAFLGKFCLFLAVIAAVLFRLPVEPLSFAAGVTVFTVALLTSTAVASCARAWREV